MKTVLSLNSYHYRRGGSDVVYFDHAELLESKGWKNTFFAMNHPRNLHSDDDKYFAELVDFEFQGGQLSKIKTALRTIYNGQARSKLKELLQTKSFSIAHVHCIYHHLTPAVFKDLYNAEIPIVLTAHDLKVACPAYKMMHKGGVCEECKSGNFLNVIKNKCIKDSISASAIIAFEAYLYKYLGVYQKYVSHIIAPSKFYRDKIIEWGYDPARVSYIPNFTKSIPGRFESDYNGNILFFGRLSEEKGLKTLIRASKIACVPIDIIGTGPLKEELATLISSLDAPVNLLGRLDGDDLWRRVGNCKAVVIPSEWYENAPMSILEAYQLRRPVIGANIGGIPELVAPNGIKEECGWLFKSGNSKMLANILGNIAIAPESVLSAKGTAGKKLVLNQFSKERYYSAIEEVYKNL